jgi:hypothetical protein
MMDELGSSGKDCIQKSIFAGTSSPLLISFVAYNTNFLLVHEIPSVRLWFLSIVLFPVQLCTYACVNLEVQGRAKSQIPKPCNFTSATNMVIQKVSSLVTHLK